MFAPLSFDWINVLCLLLNGARFGIGQVVVFGSRREMFGLLAVHYAGNNYRGLNRLYWGRLVFVVLFA